MIKYKKGDKVFIRHLTPKERHETSIFYATEMVKYEGTIGTVVIEFQDCYRLNVKSMANTKNGHGMNHG